MPFRNILSNECIYENFRPSSHQSKKEKLIYKKEDLNLSEDIFEEKINVTLPTSAMNNGTFWSRVILYPTGKRQLATQAFGRMISYQVPIRYANLLGDENAKDIGKTLHKIVAINVALFMLAMISKISNFYR